MTVNQDTAHSLDRSSLKHNFRESSGGTSETLCYTTMILYTADRVPRFQTQHCRYTKYIARHRQNGYSSNLQLSDVACHSCYHEQNIELRELFRLDDTHTIWSINLYSRQSRCLNPTIWESNAIQSLSRSFSSFEDRASSSCIGNKIERKRFAQN